MQEDLNREVLPVHRFRTNVSLNLTLRTHEEVLSRALGRTIATEYKRINSARASYSMREGDAKKQNRADTHLARFGDIRRLFPSQGSLFPTGSFVWRGRHDVRACARQRDIFKSTFDGAQWSGERARARAR